MLMQKPLNAEHHGASYQFLSMSFNQFIIEK